MRKEFMLLLSVILLLALFTFWQVRQSAAPPTHTPTLSHEQAFATLRADFSLYPPANALRSPDGKYFAAAYAQPPYSYSNALVGLWDARTGAFIMMLHEQWPDISQESLQFTPDSAVLTTNTAPVIFWRLDTFQPVYARNTLTGSVHAAFTLDMRSAAVYGCGRLIVHGTCLEPFLDVVDTHSGALRQTYNPFRLVIISIQFVDNDLKIEGCVSQLDYGRCTLYSSGRLNLDSGAWTEETLTSDAPPPQ